MTLLLAASLITAQSTTLYQPLDASAIAQTMDRAFTWQMANPNGTEIRDWVIAPLYDGFLAASQATGDPKYLTEAVRKGTQAGWQPGDDIYHADRHAVGDSFLQIYQWNPTKPERLKPFRDRFNYILANPITEDLSYGTTPKTKGVRSTDRWTWCDALYMGPPTLAQLAQATRDARYLDFMDAEYQATYKALFDPEANLFYRDPRFIGQRTPNGHKVFWSRGNGWVFAGLAKMIPALPTERKSREFYINLFKRMAPAIRQAQQPDGLWYPSLLDPKQVAMGETSGSAFFVYGLAWGINHGYLDRATYWPAVVRGWNGLRTHVSAEGRVGFVQRIGDSPDSLSAESTQLYGTGGVLMAGSEVIRALGAASSTPASTLLDRAQRAIANDRTPRAYVRFVPERKDDLAWENDLAAFRIYGPALKSAPEGSGIDVWAKRVAFPVIDRWYADDLAGRRSYHQDHGEGLDGYDVVDTPGVGGTAIWNQDALHKADVYERANIFFTKSDVAEFEVFYTYPAVDGKIYAERKRIRLNAGQRVNAITSRFTLAGKPAADLPIAIGLQGQSANAQLDLNARTGVMAIWDRFTGNGAEYGIGARVPEGSQMLRRANAANPRADQTLAITRTNAQGEVRYAAGFGWPANGIARLNDWTRFLESVSLK